MRYSFRFSLILSFLVLGGSGCTTTSKALRIFPNEFPKLSHRPASARVEGESCGSATLMGVRFSPGPKVFNAIEDALKKSGPEYNGLADVKVSERFYLKTVFAFSCILVNGLPIRIGKAGLPAAYVPSNKVPEGTKENQWHF